jgi:hypothetical protein
MMNRRIRQVHAVQFPSHISGKFFAKEKYIARRKGEALIYKECGREEIIKFININ